MFYRTFGTALLLLVIGQGALGWTLIRRAWRSKAALPEEASGEEAA